jgi:hypothetical protein
VISSLVRSFSEQKYWLAVSMVCGKSFSSLTQEDLEHHTILVQIQKLRSTFQVLSVSIFYYNKRTKNRSIALVQPTLPRKWTGEQLIRGASFNDALESGPEPTPFHVRQTKFINPHQTKIFIAGSIPHRLRFLSAPTRFHGQPIERGRGVLALGPRGAYISILLLLRLNSLE